MRPMRIVCGAAGCGAAVLLAVLLPLTAAAHEHREVAGGQYELTVGFLDEPAFVGEKNGLSLRVVRPAAAGGAPTAGAATEDAGTPVEGLIGTLQAEVMFGDQRMPLPLLPAFGDPGHYTSYFFPSTPGGYTFHGRPVRRPDASARWPVGRRRGRPLADSPSGDPASRRGAAGTGRRSPVGARWSRAVGYRCARGGRWLRPEPR